LLELLSKIVVSFIVKLKKKWYRITCSSWFVFKRNNCWE